MPNQAHRTPLSTRSRYDLNFPTPYQSKVFGRGGEEPQYVPLPYLPAQHCFGIAFKRVGEHANGPGRFGDFADGLIQFDDGRTVFADHATGGNDSHLRLFGYVVDAAQDMRRLFQRRGQPLVRILRQLCIRFCKPADARQRLAKASSKFTTVKKEPLLN